MTKWQILQKQKSTFKELTDLAMTTLHMTEYSENDITETDMEDWRDWLFGVMDIVGEAFGYNYLKNFRRFVHTLYTSSPNKTEEIKRTSNYLIDIRKRIKLNYDLY